ncbi:MAG: glycerol kinase [Thermoleophilaceae bacterium]|nr:glycerol kinase [Thermoleophilaceae bacterium]MEA2388909.1 glycerol kinase [Thermoleophilaceae bacterium]
MTRLLGIDEGTSAVKAILFDEDLRPLAEARREKALVHPRPGWVEQDPEEVLGAVVSAVGELLDGADGDDVVAGLDHQGESVLAWDAETGGALTPIVTWQDKRSQEVLDRLEADGVADEVRELSRMPLDPYFSAGKLAWLLENDETVAAARERGVLRLGTVDAFLCDRLGAGYATDPATASRTQLGAPAWDARLLEIFGVPEDALPPIVDSVGEIGTLSHESWPRELPLRARCPDQQAALAGAGCVVPGRTKATYGTGVFVLAHVGDAAPSGSGGLLPTIAWSVDGRVEWALDGGVFTAGALLEWLSRDLGLAADPPALAAAAAAVDDAAGVRVLPALAGVGAPWWRPAARGVIAGLTAGVRPGHVARAALESIAWRVADVVEAVGEHAPVDVLRVDGGLTRDALLLRLQADAAGVPVERGAVDATAAGAAALAAVGAGLWPSTASIAERIPVGERVEPERDAAWRDGERAAWRAFVERAVEL